jgi:hypothetical protein
MSDEGSSFLFCPVSVFHQRTNMSCHVILAVGTTTALLHRAIGFVTGFLTFYVTLVEHLLNFSV